jgi:MFS family permease
VDHRLFVVSAVSLAAFVLVERASPAPMLDLRYLSAAVNGALFVGFATYFGIFSIFVLGSLYLQEVEGYSAARLAATFAPMAVAIILASVAAGRWVARAGTRAPMATGCLLAAGGTLLTGLVIDAQGSVALLVAALALAGSGFGLAIVPSTAGVLTALPAERSGMAASTVNTSRQIGAVAGVAVLGSLVNAHLAGDLRTRLSAAGIPASLQSFVIDAIQQGRVPGGGVAGGESRVARAGSGILGQIIRVADDSFRDGVASSLLVASIMIVLAAVVSWWTGKGATALGESRPPASNATH